MSLAPPPSLESNEAPVIHDANAVGSEPRRGGRKRKVTQHAAFLDAAIAEFTEKGYAATRMSDVAGRLGIVRSTLYRYFDDKEDLFRAVIVDTIMPKVEALREFSASYSTSLADLLRSLVAPMARMVTSPPLGAVLKTVIGESGNFPELARIWNDQLMVPAMDILASSITEAQKRGEVRAGDPQAFAFQILSPLMAALIWRQTTSPNGSPDFDVEMVLDQCVETFLAGVLIEGGRVDMAASHSD